MPPARVDVVGVDPQDDAALRAWWEAEQEALRADRPDAVLRPWGALRSFVQRPSAYHRRELVAAVLDGRTVGTAHLMFWLRGNDHVASVDVTVRPGHRRQGIGRALFAAADRRRRAAGRTTILGEVTVPAGRCLEEDPGGRFAAAIGLETVHTEDHQVLRLPVPEERLARLVGAVGDRAAAYDVVTWGNRCPDEHVAAYCAMNTQMSADVPRGELDVEPVVYDEERLRTGEARTAAAYDQVVAAARRRADGVFGGYSLVYLPHGEVDALQDDTLVMPGHRGHRLGTVLKLATLEVIRRDRPERHTWHTWTEPANRAMNRTNAEFGFVAVERTHELQRKDEG